MIGYDLEAYFDFTNDPKNIGNCKECPNNLHVSLFENCGHECWIKLKVEALERREDG